MRYFRGHAQLALCLVVCLLLGTTPTWGQSPDTPQPAECTADQLAKCTPGDECKPVGNLCLGKFSLELAHEVCLKDRSKACAYDAYNLIERLGEIDPGARCNARATEALLLRQEISEMILTTSLQVDGFLAEVDSETAEVRAVHDDLTGRQTTTVANSTLVTAAGTGGGAVGSALALVRKTAAVGNWVGATSGGVAAIFSFLGWRQGVHGPKGCFPNVGQDPKHCVIPKEDPCDPKANPPGCSPTMLYHLVFPNAPDTGLFHSEYDEGIKKYLEEKPPGGKSRAERLIDPWIAKAKDDQAQKEKKGKKDNPAVPDDPVRDDPNYVLKREEPSLFTSGKQPLRLSIDDLSDRANKLADLRNLVARMNRHLSRLTEDLATELQCPPQRRNALTPPALTGQSPNPPH